jgi:hypothetical protein
MNSTARRSSASWRDRAFVGVVRSSPTSAVAGSPDQRRDPTRFAQGTFTSAARTGSSHNPIRKIGRQFADHPRPEKARWPGPSESIRICTCEYVVADLGALCQ